MFKCTGNCAECPRKDKCITYRKKIQGVTSGFQRNFTKNPLIADGFGLAVDLGTTTAAGYLYEFPACECVDTVCIPNPQAQFGADVISRIEYSNANGVEPLKSAAWEVIDRITELFGKPVKTCVITGNTVMLHFLTGLDTRSIAVAPFTPQSLFGEYVCRDGRPRPSAQRKRNPTDDRGGRPYYLPHCISSYVGADITCGILASGMMEDKCSFLVDIGTNGEMALWNKGKLVCCATAAGPAFERGMGASGTELVDALAQMLEQGIVDETGYLEENYKIGDSGTVITGEDVRQLQLAKAAIRAGIETLLHECNVSYGAIGKFYIAGSFGSNLNKMSCAKIGLIPTGVLDKVVILGNAAGMGASMILQSSECLAESERIASLAETVELSANAYFMEQYINNMMFGGK